MGSDFSVEAIVAQIRTRIAQEKSRRPAASQRRSFVSEGPDWDMARYRRRMEDDAARFADLDRRLEDATQKIGQQPLAPPSWRGQVGSWAVQVLRRLLWWYGLPIKEAIAQTSKRLAIDTCSKT